MRRTGAHAGYRLRRRDAFEITFDSFLGLIASWPTLAGPVTTTTLDPAAVDAAETSLLLPLDQLAGTDRGSTVTLFARNPGAFVDLAADTRFAYQLDGDIVLDPHRRGDNPDGQPAAPSLDDLSQINQTIGVLTDQGNTPGHAHTDLQHRAAAANHTIQQAAVNLLGTLL